MYLLPCLARCISHFLPFSFCYIVNSSFAVLAGSVAPLWTCITGLEDGCPLAWRLYFLYS